MPAPRRAVVIGVNDYKDRERIPQLTGAVNDAQEVYNRLTESGNFEISKEHFLLNDQATCEAIRKALNDLLWCGEPGDVSLFYFSGHGFKDQYRNGYIAPYDMKRNEPFVLGIRAEELREVVRIASSRTERAKDKESIVAILDCCYSGCATDGKGDDSTEEPPVDKWYENPKGEADGGGWTILASSGKDEKSREVLKRSHEMDDQPPHDHGGFTYYLLEGLDGKAGDGEQITLADLQRYVSGEMKSMGLPRLRFAGAGVGDAGNVLITTAGKRRNINKLLEEAEEWLKGATDNPAKIFRATKNLAKVPPRLPAVNELKNRIDQKLIDYRRPINDWLLTNKVDLSSDLPGICKFLEDSARVLNADLILSLSDDKQGMLVGLCEVSKHLRDDNVYIDQLKNADQPKTVIATERQISGNKPRSLLKSSP